MASAGHWIDLTHIGDQLTPHKIQEVSSPLYESDIKWLLQIT